MSEYMILTDSACDMKADVLEKWGVQCLDLCFRFEGEDKEYGNSDMPIGDFYARMREGGVAKTSAINIEGFASAFEAVLAAGKDVLYLGFSSGLSTTYNSACIAAEELKEKYPDRKVLTVDTLCASAGQGLLLYLAVKQKQAGATVEEVADYVVRTRLQLCHWFTVDDLVYLKRGGRVSSAVALIGTVLGIKPVLHVDDEGKLISVSKVRGRKAALDALADKYGELALRDGSPVFISHADSTDDAEFLKARLQEKYGVEVEIVTDVGAVIGAHSGPGTMALFFLGKQR